MMTARAAAGVLLLVTAPVALARGQAPPRDGPRVSAPGTASIAGMVVAGDRTGEPVRRATITVWRAGMDDARVTATDDRGRFLVQRLPDGVYLLRASKGGYVTASYGAAKPWLPGSPIPLSAGQSFTAEPIALMRGGVITGRLVDGVDRPAAATIEAAQFQVVEGERRRLTLPLTALSASTDAHGVFRIHSLPPGEYVVGARPVRDGTGARLSSVTPEEIRWAEQQAAAPPPAGPPGARPAGPERPPAPVVPRSNAVTFYPGTGDAAEAEVIRIAPGEERAGVDFRLQFVQTANVHGQAIGPDGAPARGAVVRAVPARRTWAAELAGISRTYRTGNDGGFTVTNLQPGTYVVSVRAGASREPAARELLSADPGGSPRADTPPLWGAADVTVAGSDVENLVIALQPGTIVSGRIVFDGPTPAGDLSGLQLVLTAGDGPADPYYRPVAAAADGTFQFDGVVPGAYRLSVTLPPPLEAGTWAVRSAVAGGRDVLDVPLDVSPGVAVSGVVVTLTNRQTELTGALVDRSGQPMPQLSILVFARDRAMWRSESRWIRFARAGVDGSFTVTGLPAGEYHLCALTEIDPSLVYDASYLEQLVAASIPIVLREGERQVQHLQVGDTLPASVNGWLAAILLR